MKLILLIIGTFAAILLSLFFGAANLSLGQTPVSYTHLTLPTKA